MLNQLCDSFRTSEKISSSLQKKGKAIEDALKERSGRARKVVMVTSEDHVITVLPESIVISKNLMMKNEMETDLANTVLIMEALFSKRYHIKDLALSNVGMFLRGSSQKNPLTDLKLTSIYTRQYSHQ